MKRFFKTLTMLLMLNLSINTTCLSSYDDYSLNDNDETTVSSIDKVNEETDNVEEAQESFEGSNLTKENPKNTLTNKNEEKIFSEEKSENKKNDANLDKSKKAPKNSLNKTSEVKGKVNKEKKQLRSKNKEKLDIKKFKLQKSTVPKESKDITKKIELVSSSKTSSKDDNSENIDEISPDFHNELEKKELKPSDWKISIDKKTSSGNDFTSIQQNNDQSVPANDGKFMLILGISLVVLSALGLITFTFLLLRWKILKKRARKNRQ